MTNLLDPSTEHFPKEGLHQAFELFNEMSQQLTDSYQKLESQVQVLSGELAEVSAARMRELKEKERLADRLHSLLQLLPGGVVVLDGTGRIQEVNRAASQLLANDALKGKLWRDVVAHSFSPRADDGHEVSLKNGNRLSIQTTGFENEPGQIVLMTDQTETRELQDKLARHERLTAMGKMVASLAHQVRTPLSGAMLYAQHLGKDDLDEHTRYRFSEKLTRQLKNIEAQVRDMMIFARGSAPLNKVISSQDLISLIDESRFLLKKQYQAEIDIQSELTDQSIQCHLESLIGAIQNIISNGIEAAEESHQSARVIIRLHADASNVYIDVSDNGPGIEDDCLKKLMEPFYTTKANGTGLGLPVVNAVIRAHHGALNISNLPNGGACFQIALPNKNSFDKEYAHAHI